MKSEVRVECNRLQITRVFNAPRPVVFGWWANAEKLQRWSGCKEAINCRIRMDFRIGGAFTQQMQISVNDKVCDFSIKGTYLEIAVPEKIIYEAHLGPVPTRVTVEFFEHGEGTKVVLLHEGLPDAAFAGNVSHGTAESFDKLDSLVSAQVVANGQ